MINGVTLRDAFISGANSIINAKQQVDALNVFPVPDGDTGTNMSMTMSAAKRELERLGENATVSEVAAATASACLRGARGNSGVILSLLMRGFAKGLAGKAQMDIPSAVAALTLGVEAAYKAVMKPTEGTMLTVARLSAERAARECDEYSDFPAFWAMVLEECEAALAQTPELLPVLKKAGVVDAGGRGLIHIFEGMGAVFGGGTVVALQDAPAHEAQVQRDEIYNAAGEFDGGEIIFPYCTEFIVQRTQESADPLALRSYLESIGDSVVVVDDDEIIKCHVHTDNPGLALQEAIKFGSLHNLKIENMHEQHTHQVASVQAQKRPAYQPVDEEREVGFVAVAAGEGVRTLFMDLGVDTVVTGGQTMNPSTDDILNAIHATAAKTVFVLPNNKNIIMAAEQAAALADRKVIVLQTLSIPQGMSAMLTYDPDKDVKTNGADMTHAFERVGTGLITYAARDSEYDGHKIQEGDLLALHNGKLLFTESSVQKAVVRLTRQMVRHEGVKEISFITLLYGEEVSEEEATLACEEIRTKLPADVEVSAVFGGQPVYHYIVSVE